MRRSRRCSSRARRARRSRARARSARRAGSSSASGTPSLGRARNCPISALVARGDSSDSPDATTRIASISTSGSTPLPRNPLAPARSAATTYSSASNVVSTSTLTSFRAASDVISSVAESPSVPGHPDVHQHDVRLRGVHLPHGIRAVDGLTDDLQIGRRGQQRGEAGADQLLVVGDEHADGHGRTGRLGAHDPGPGLVRPGGERAPGGRDPLPHAQQPVLPARRGGPGLSAWALRTSKVSPPSS